MGEQSRVRSFFAGKNVFITGGTGFVGLCLIEKLLRCTDVGRLYLLMRPKKGKQISERLDEFRKNPVFEKLLEISDGEVFSKLQAVSGDVGEEGLGLSAEDRRELCDSVHVVIHSAATLDFQENLRSTVNVNLLGTRRVTELCSDMKQLKTLVHVSSAYVNSYLTEAEERLYDAPADADQVISLVGTLSDDALDEIQPKVLGSHPNTYTFTKHLAEHEVARFVRSSDVPASIVRPTMIVAAWQQPVAGWTCSKVGPQGFLMGAAKGVVRRLPIALDRVADYIPVDVVVNHLLVSAAYSHSHTNNSSGEAGRLGIYHVSSSTSKPFRWRLLEGDINNILHQYPLRSAVWYPHLSFVGSLLMFRVSAIFVHFVPALLLDTMLRLTGGRPILWRLHTNVWKSLSRLEKFIFSEWRFHNTNSRDLATTMTARDQAEFYIDIHSLHWKEYFTNLHLGVRRYLNKETERTLPAARSKDTVLLALHVLWQLGVIYLAWYLVATLTGLSMTASSPAAPLAYLLYSAL